MCDLCIKHKIANKVVLANEGWGIFTEIMKDLHDLVRLENFFKPVLAWVHGSKIYQEALVGEVNLDQLHASAFGETFTI